MLNSKYAPPVALAVVVAMMLAALGYFLGIKPTIDDAGALFDRERLVRSNIDVIAADSAAIDESAKALAQSQDQAAVITANAPSTIDLAGFQDRLVSSVRASNVEVKSVQVASPVVVEPLVVDPAIRPSSSLAQHYQSLGLARQGGEPVDPQLATPVVTAPAPEAPVVDSLYQVDVSFEVKGSPAEVIDFLRRVTDPAQRLLLVNGVQAIALQETDLPDPGMGPNADGDLQVRFSGSLFMLDPDLTVVDEDSEITFTLPADGGLVIPEPIEPQPGANK